MVTDGGWLTTVRPMPWDAAHGHSVAELAPRIPNQWYAGPLCRVVLEGLQSRFGFIFHEGSAPAPPVRKLPPVLQNRPLHSGTMVARPMGGDADGIGTGAAAGSQQDLDPAQWAGDAWGA